MKKILTLIVVFSVFISGCANHQQGDENLRTDSLKLIGDLTIELEYIVGKEKSDYSTNWYKEKYQKETDEIAVGCINVCDMFESVKKDRDIDKLDTILDNMLEILNKLK